MASSPAPVPSVWITNEKRSPRGYAAVTTPCVVTVRPTSGLAAPGPWISAMVASVAVGGGSSSGGHTAPEFCGSGSPVVKSSSLTSVSERSTSRELEVLLAVPSAHSASHSVAAP